MRRRSPLQTRKGAEEYERAFARELGDDLAAGRDPFAGPPPTLAEFAPRWMRDYVVAHNRPSSRRSKEAALRRHLLPSFGSHRLDEITTARIDTFVAAKEREDLAPKTVLNLTSMIHCILSVAQDWKLLRSVPKTRWVKVPLQRYRHLKSGEVDRLLTAAPPGFIRTLLLFFVRTGARFGEAAALRWDDLTLDGDDPIVHFWRSATNNVEGPTKTNLDRSVPLTPDLVTSLRRLPRTDEHVFWLGTGSFMKPSTMQRYLTRVALSASIPYVTWKDLRHTFATELTVRNISLRVVQELLGHTTVKTTARYVHVAPSMLRGAVLKLLPPEPADESASDHLIATRRLRGTLWATSTVPLLVEKPSTNAKADP